MNDVRDMAPVQQHELQQGLSILHTRRNKMRILTVLSAVLMVLSAVAIFFNQSLVYSYFDLADSVKHLHIPISAHEIQDHIGQAPNYFFALISSIFWLALKIVMALIGATIFVVYAKKINFFKKRMHNFGKRFLAWVISFCLIMMASSAIQHQMTEKSHEEEKYLELVEYKNNIQQSEMYQLIQDRQVEPTVADYLLAQTALLNDPADKDTAFAYVTKLITAEQNDPNFLSYGFKPDQIWAMQQQTHHKAVTPFAESIQEKMATADKIAGYSQWLWVIIFTSFAVFAFIFYGLTRQFNRRITRIENRLN